MSADVVTLSGPDDTAGLRTGADAVLQRPGRRAGLAARGALPRS